MPSKIKLGLECIGSHPTQPTPPTPPTHLHSKQTISQPRQRDFLFHSLCFSREGLLVGVPLKKHMFFSRISFFAKEDLSSKRFSLSKAENIVLLTQC